MVKGEIELTYIRVIFLKIQKKETKEQCRESIKGRWNVNNQRAAEERCKQHDEAFSSAPSMCRQCLLPGAERKARQKRLGD